MGKRESKDVYERFAAFDFKEFAPPPILPILITKHRKCKNAPLDWFYPAQGLTPKGKKLCCDVCPVQPQCLEYAIKNNIHYGLWGGLTERERFNVKRVRRNSKA
tara:strand:- start:161 stop:472 length:312 start_codon:yes stop_codon:yes gene_type:complete